MPFWEQGLSWFSSLNLYIQENFGIFALITFYLLLVYFLLMVLAKILKEVLRLVFYILLPSFALTFLTSFFISYSFFNILPFFVCLLLGINLLKILK